MEARGREIVVCDGEPPEDGWIGPVDGAEDSDGWPPDPTGRPDLAVSPMARAGKILVVGRTDPVLRDRERRWISTMAELADLGWPEVS